MATKRATAAPEQGPKVGPRSGYTKAIYSLEPGQVEALRAEAIRRTDPSRSGRPDASVLVREAVREWLARHGGKKR